MKYFLLNVFIIPKTLITFDNNKNNMMTRNIFFAVLFIVVSLLISCSGDYNANPDSNANYSVNPLLGSTYNWGGTGIMGANINGTPWVASTTGVTYTFSNSTGYNAIVGTNNNIQYIELELYNVYGGNKYAMGLHNGAVYGVLHDSTLYNVAPKHQYDYFSYLGNSGGVEITENDSAWFKGLFYFQGVDSLGNIINVTNGYFNIPK